MIDVFRTDVAKDGWGVKPNPVSKFVTFEDKKTKMWLKADSGHGLVLTDGFKSGPNEKF